MASARIQAKSGTVEGKENSTTILKEREMAYIYPDEIGKGNVKLICGDGNTEIKDLPYVAGDDAADMQVSHIDGETDASAEIVSGLRLSELFAIIRDQLNAKSGNMSKDVYDPEGGEAQVAFKSDLDTLESNIESNIDSKLTDGSVTKLGTATVGSGTKPIYLDSGSPTASSSTVGSGTVPIYMSSGTLTASSSTVGSGTVPIYMSSGTLTASSSTVGGTARGLYLNSGTLTALSATVGSGTQPVYLSSGTITACATTVGSGTKPIYSASGVLTASSSTVGGTAKPVYLSSGTITACSSTVGGTATPIYSNSGTLTALSATVGGTTTPVYLKSGVLTACSYGVPEYSAGNGSRNSSYVSSTNFEALYQKYGRVCCVEIALYMSAACTSDSVAIVTGLPKPAAINAYFVVQSSTSDTCSLRIYEGDGGVYLGWAGTLKNSGMYYGSCAYITAS